MDNIQDLQDLFHYISNEIGLDLITLFFKNVRKGRAHYRTRKIMMPVWIFQRPIEYQYYYIIHELCHFISPIEVRRYGGHGPQFKIIEQYWLAQFGLQPVYKKAYPKKLLSLTGQILWRQAS